MAIYLENRLKNYSQMTSAKQKSKSIFTGLQRKPNMMTSFLMLPTSSFGQAPYPIANKEVGDEGSYLQEDEVSNFSQCQFPQKRVEIISPQNYPHMHPLIKRLLYVENIQTFRPAGPLQYLLRKWEKLTSDPFILELVKRVQITFLSEPFQTTTLSSIPMSQKETVIVDQETQEMLKKGAIQLVQPNTKIHFLGSIFIVQKNDSEHRPVINLKKLNKLIPHIHFKQKEILLKGDCMCKININDTYFSVPLNPKSFKCKDLIYQFLCFRFGLGPAPRILTKLLKVPISLMRQLNV